MKKYIHILLVIGALVLIPSVSIAEGFKHSPYAGFYGASSNIDTNPEADGMDFGVFAGLKFEQLTQTNLAFTGAIEIFLGGSDVEAENNATFEKKIERGISLRPGLAFKPARNFKINPYAILGYRHAEFELSNATTSITDDFSGFELGLGTSLILLDNLDFRLEYTRTFYGESSGLDMEEDSFRLGLAYHF